jgi:hypothetical protein
MYAMMTEKLEVVVNYLRRTCTHRSQFAFSWRPYTGQYQLSKTAVIIAHENVSKRLLKNNSESAPTNRHDAACI